MMEPPMAGIFPKARLLVPSWVIPGTYLENLRFLEGKSEIQGVELLFFIYDDEIRDQLDAEWEGIKQFADRFVFTAHLPDPLLPEHEELVNRLNPMVRSFIVHPGPPEDAPAQGALVNGWAKKYPPEAGAEGSPYRFLAENTNAGRLEALLPYLEYLGICMDTGHLLMDGKSPAEFFKDHSDRIGEIHLHGVDREKAAIDGRLADHRPVRAEEKWFGELFPLLKQFTGNINAEVFSWEEAAAGINSIRKYTYGKH
ncbi:AP endonuclease [Treponema primitia]|uniref:cobamide remodeling phosphodiesterase CbiR n=1 Tax=Treponema primitia TaxID=88058 RepID=UPI00397EE3CA